MENRRLLNLCTAHLQCTGFHTLRWSIVYLTLGVVQILLEVLGPDEVVVGRCLEDGVEDGDRARVRALAHAALNLSLQADTKLICQIDELPAIPFNLPDQLL